jgi:dipeptidyl aminopeptidase/acylaminoacyl peptidase
MWRKWYVATAAMFLLAAGYASGGARLFTIEDVMAVRSLADARFSPEGLRIVYSVGENDSSANVERSSLWVVAVGGGAPLRLTYLTKRDRLPHWSPDGTLIAFLSDRDSADELGKRVEGRTQVWVMSTSGGEARQVTRSPTAISEFAWAPDGTRVVYAAPAWPPGNDQREGRRRDGFDAVVAGEHQMSELWLVELASGRSTRLTDGRSDATEAAWSPGGDLIAFVARPTPGANEQLLSDLFVVSAAGGVPRKLTDNDGPDFAPAWSPDGSRIAYLSNRRRQSSGALNTIMVVSLPGGTPHSVVQGFEHSAGRPVWAPDGRTIFFNAETRTESHVYTVSAAGGPTTLITSGAGVVGAFDVSHDGRRLAFVRQDAKTPQDLWVSATDGSGPTQLTHINPQLSEIQIAASEVIRWKAADDWDIEGVLVKPPDYVSGKRYPLIVEAHGGPHGAQTVAFNPMWQYFAAHGFVVLAPNFRGSGGYSQDFIDADRYDWGGKDYGDLMAGVDAVIARGLADSDRLGIEGWSYGGFMTSWVIGHTNRFKAAVVGAGVTNLQSFYGTTDIQRFIEWEYRGFPWDNAAAIRDHSPIMFAQNARTPTLILHGREDVRVPVEQGQQLYMVLKKVGTTVEFVRYPREGHGFLEPNHVRDRYERTLAWFERFLASKAPATSSQSY